MNQIKIGKFIASCCKEKNMTQRKLADIQFGLTQSQEKKFREKSIHKGREAGNKYKRCYRNYWRYVLLLRMRFLMTNDYYAASAADTEDLFHKWLAVHSPVRYCMMEAALGFMRGMIWAGVSMFASLYLTDRLVITMFPFLGSYMIVWISQMLSIDDKWRPDQILIGRTVVKDSGHTVMIAAIVSGVLVFLMGCAFTRI